MSAMAADLPLHSDLPPAEWRRSGHFFLLAVVLHLAALAYPLGLMVQRLEIPPPATVSVRLVEALRPAPPPPVRTPPAEPQPRPASTPRATPRPQPVLAMTPQQQPVSAATPTIAAAPTPAPPADVPAPRPAAAPAPLPVTAARFDAAYLHNPEPNYPPLSRRLGEEGKVLLRVRVSAEGQPLTVDLEKTSNFERLDEAARQVVRRWRFVPAKRGDEAIEASVIVPIVFRLEN